MVPCFHRPGRMTRTQTVTCRNCSIAIEECPCVDETHRKVNRDCVAPGVRDWFLHLLSQRLARVRIIHGDWTRTLNHHYGLHNGGAAGTAIFFDPPYLGYERLYAKSAQKPVALAVAEWCRAHEAEARIALCGNAGDYDLPGWRVMPWSRGKLTYGGAKTTADECVWFSPACLDGEPRGDLL